MTRDNITDDDFILSLKSDNKYIPIHGNVYFGTVSKKVFIKRPNFERSGKSNTIGNIRKAFDHGYNATIIIGEKTFYFARGVMYDSNFNILMLIAQEKEHNLKVVTTILPRDLKGNTDFVFFYSTELMINPEYATLHRRMHKEIVTPYLIKGMEVRILSSSIIAENTFVRKTVVKKFSSLDKLDNYLKDVLPTFLYEDRVEEPESIKEERQISSVFTDTPGTDGEHFNTTLNTGDYIINSTTFTTSLTGSTTSISSSNDEYGFFDYIEREQQSTERDQNEDDGLTDASWNEELPVEEEALLYGVPGEEDPEIVLYTSAEGAEAIDEAFRASLEQEGHDYDYEEEPEEDIQSEQEMEASWFEEQERLTDAAIAASQTFLASQHPLSSDESYRSLVERLRPHLDAANLTELRIQQILAGVGIRQGTIEDTNLRLESNRRRSTWREERIELIDDTSSIELIDDTE